MGQRALPQVFALEMTLKGGRYQSLGSLAGGQTVKLSLGTTPLQDRETVVQEIKEQIRIALARVKRG